MLLVQPGAHFQVIRVVKQVVYPLAACAVVEKGIDAPTVVDHIIEIIGMVRRPGSEIILMVAVEIRAQDSITEPVVRAG